MQRLKALVKYDGAELDSAVLNAIFAAYIESPNDPQMVEQALGADEVGPYQKMRADYHNEKRLTMDGALLPLLFLPLRRSQRPRHRTAYRLRLPLGLPRPPLVPLPLLRLPPRAGPLSSRRRSHRSSSR